MENLITDHKGNIFNTGKEMCNYYDIAYATFRKRIREGYSLEDALTKPIHKPSADHEGNVFKSEKDMCKYWNISNDVFRKRIKSGYSIKDALTKPVSLGKMIYGPDNRIYNTIKDMCDEYGINYDTYIGRLSSGQTMEQALGITQIYKYVDPLGNGFNTIEDMAKYWHITYYQYGHRKNENKWSLEKTLTTPTLNMIYGNLEMLNIYGNYYEVYDKSNDHKYIISKKQYMELIKTLNEEYNGRQL